MLSEDRPFSSKEISENIDTSARTVTNYINEINSLSEEKIIFSSENRYWLNKTAARSLLEEKTEIPQDFDERSLYIIRALLKDHVDSLNIYQLCDDLFVSYSTIKSDLAKMNQLYHYLDIRFSLKNNRIFLLGNETSKRKLMSKIVYDQHKDILNISAIEEAFPEVDVRRLSIIISRLLQEYHYYLNDFARVNLIMHYALFISRIQHGHYVASGRNIEIKLNNAAEKGIIDEITRQLKDNFDLILSNEELIEFLMLLRANARKIEQDTTQLTSETVDPEIAEYVKRIVRKVQDIYYIDLDDDQFTIPFIIHVKYLIIRSKEDIFIQNPLINSLKQVSPVLLDAAAYIANDLKNYFRLKKPLSYDEIGFIAIHLGAQIERQNNDINKVDAVLLCPDYIQLAATVRNKILYNLGTKINIVATISDPADLQQYQADLLISTMPLSYALSLPSCILSPFVSETDISRLFSFVCEIIDHRNLQILKNDFDYYFSGDNFICSDSGITKEECIHQMAALLMHNGFVSIAYENEVLEREKSVPTSFTDFALPHSYEMDAFRTGVCVLISKEGIQWGENLVHLVLMISMNKRDIIYFYQLYEAVITLFSQRPSSSFVNGINSFSDFKEIIFSLIQ